MKILEALIVVKRSALERLHSNREIDHREAHLESLERNARVHQEALDKIRAVLRRKKIGGRVVKRPSLPKIKRPADSYDIVITVGGDGTLLRGSHFVMSTPVLGVNSSPERSIGLLCGANAANFEEVFDSIIRDRLRPTVLQRVQAYLRMKPICPPTLNEILFSHANPAATSRYDLIYRGQSQAQKSSGVWVATAAGSTAAINAAGGKIVPIGSDKLQFVVRELYYPDDRSGIRKGFVKPGQKLEIRSTTIGGAVYADGQPTGYQVPFGSKISFALSKYPLILLGYNRRKRKEFEINKR